VIVGGVLAGGGGEDGGALTSIVKGVSWALASPSATLMVIDW
jgi:hypothetical protein